ncbi:MAG: hypothetical protein A3C83_02190 [Candidatus Ryanbacteria bacterium RIFCSPHIGHO2_02_FULL_47_25]|nr:MAG: hypothetical protein A3C83_02190 [Candidatus Ryanbacteria bacterium RIFCSPHIGHO2_02_FULL_47_25]
MRGLLKSVLLAIALAAIASSAEARRTYVIRPGDTPDGLRSKFTPSLAEVKRANPGVDLDVLRVGDTVIDPRHEDEDVDAFHREIADLKAKLASVTSERDKLKSELSRVEAHASELEARVAEIAPQAATARYYQGQFNRWVGALGVALAVALVTTWLQVRSRGRLDRKILEIQKELAAERSAVANTLAQRARAATIPPLPVEKVANISARR